MMGKGRQIQNTTRDKLRKRNRELSILNEIAQALNRETDLDHALQTTLALILSLLDLKTGWVWLLNEETDHTYLAASQNLPPGLAGDPHHMTGSCHCLDTYRSGDMSGAANINVVTCSRLEALVDGTNGLAYHACIPLYDHGKKVGVLNVASCDWRQLSAEDLRLLYTVGDMLSIGVERARLFARSAMLGAADERNRLAREIHDTLAQGLSAIALKLEAAEAMLEDGTASASTEKASGLVGEALNLTRANLEEARRSVLDLRSAPLEGRTLAQALCALAEKGELDSRATTTEGADTGEPLHVKVMIKGKVRPLPVRVETALYRIAQEAVTNLARHAGAECATLKLVFMPDYVCLLIEDNGRGFDTTQVREGCYGLMGMNERVKLLGGEFCVQSHPGAGTRIEAMVPA